MNDGPREFIVGPLRFHLETANGFVRDVQWRGQEILRGIYPAVRDETWGTVAPQVTTRVVTATPDILRLNLEASVTRGEIALVWAADIVAQAGGTLCYEWHGRAERDFATNRTGLCVLHPAEVAGLPCVIEHTDARRVAGWFPERISPHQPFSDIRAIIHSIGAAADLETRFEGEVFEMEDQRNWTDASFKTYCRPLAWPKPYPLARGTSLQQRVTVTVRGTPPPPRVADPPLRLALDSRGAKLPAVGFTITEPLPSAVRKRLRALRPDHLRVETTPADLTTALRWARAECDLLGCALIVAIRDAGPPPPRGVFPEGCTVHLFDAAGNTAHPETIAAWRGAGFDSVATGSSHHFTELNRFRPSASGAHTEIVFGINAQVHACDDRSMLETLSQHGIVARHAHALSGGRPVSVAPLILGPAPESPDVRLTTEFGALWLLGSLAQLGAGGVNRVTFARAHGRGGMMNDDRVSPIEELLRTIASAQRCEVISASETPPRFAPVVLINAQGERQLLVANASEAPVETLTPWTGPLRVAPRTLGRFPLPA